MTSNNATAANKTSAGDDLFRSTADNQLNSEDVIDGGAGTDTLKATITEGNSTTEGAATVKPALTSVENIEFTTKDGGQSATTTVNAVTLDLTDSTGVKKVLVTMADEVESAVAGVGTDVAITFKTGGATAKATATYTGLSTATDGGNDSATITLSTGDIATATVAGIETLTLNAVDGAGDIDVLTAAALEKLVITGSKSLDIGSGTAVAFSGLDTGETAVVDASASTGDAVVVAIGQLAKINATGGAGKMTTFSNTALGAAGSNTVTMTAGAGAMTATVALVTNTATATATNVATVTGGAGNDVITVTAVTNATDLTATTADESKNVTGIVNAGAGNDSVTVGAGVLSVDLGTGDDTLTLNDSGVGTNAAEITSSDKFVGGEGTDTIVGAITDLAGIAGSTSKASAFSGFEKVSVAGTLSADLDASKFGVNNVVLTGDVNNGSSAGAALTGLTSGATVEVALASAVTSSAAQAYAVAVGITNATNAGTADTLNIKLNSDLDNASANAGIAYTTKVGIAGIETVNISTADAKDDGAATPAADSFSDDGYVVTLSDTARLNTINASGDRALTLTNTNLTTVETINASGLSGDFTVDLTGVSRAIGTVITGGSSINNIAATAYVDTITGGAKADDIDAGDGADVVNAGAGNDKIVGGAAADTINGDAGDDFIVGGSGADALSGGAGKDSFVYTSKGVITESVTSPAGGTLYTLSGTFVAGEVITLNDGTNTAVTYTVKVGDTLSTIAAAVAALYDAGAGTGSSSGATYTVASILPAASASSVTTAVAAIGDTGVTVTGTGATAVIAGYDKIADFASADDTIVLAAAQTTGGSQSTATAGVATAAPVAGASVQITAGGKVAFAAADDTFAEMVQALVADDTNLADGEVAFFEFGGNTYVYAANDTSDASTDALIELTGVVGLTTLTVTSGSITFA